MRSYRVACAVIFLSVGFGARSARFSEPVGVAIDHNGNIYVADSSDQTIRKITPSGMVSVLAGSPGLRGNADGSGNNARFSDPAGVATDSSGNLYVADSSNHTVRKVTPSGVVTTFAGSPGVRGSADGKGRAARFFFPSSVATDRVGNVYVADTKNSTIRKITALEVVTTFAGAAGSSASDDGIGSAARFDNPRGVATDQHGNVYVTDTKKTVRKITPDGVVSTFAGSPGRTYSRNGIDYFLRPTGIAVDTNGNVYVADSRADEIRKVTHAGAVTTFAGGGRSGARGSADGVGDAARFNNPTGVATDTAGNVYVADSANQTIRKITPLAVVTTLAGTASSFGSADGNATSFRSPTGIAVDAAANIYVANCFGPLIQKITPAGTVTHILGSRHASATDCAAIAIDSRGNLYVAEANGQIIRKVTPAGVVSTLGGSPGVSGSGDGTPASARFSDPSGIAIDSRGNVFVADTSNHTIRKITPSRIVSTFAGTAGISGSTDGTGSAARFSFPRGITVDAQGNVYVADTMNRTIRKITPAGLVTTLAGSPGLDGKADGTGMAARFNRPRGIAADRNGNIYVADTNNHTIRKITPVGLVTTLAGSPGLEGDADGTLSAARFSSPNAVATDIRGNVYVADNGMIRRITPEAVTSTLLTR